MCVADARLAGAIAKVEAIRAVPNAEDQFEELARLLLYGNPALQNVSTSEELPDFMSDAQKVLITLRCFNNEVLNGGVMQFFWNCPKWAAYVEEAMRWVKLPELADAYCKAVDKLIGKQDAYIQLRKKDSLEAYLDAADEIDLEWFENLYFGEFDHNAKRWSGLLDKLYVNAVAFVFSNLKEFVR